MKYRKTKSLLAAAALTLSLASCGAVQTDATEQTAAEQPPASQSTQQETQSSSGKPANRQNLRMGKVTSVEGNTVTVTLGSMDRGGKMGRMGWDRNRQENTPVPGDQPSDQQSEAPEAPPADQENQENQNPPAAPDTQSPDAADNPTCPQGRFQGDMRKGDHGFTDSGETATLDLSAITKDGAAVTGEDLAEGDLLMITVDDSGAPVSAQVMTGRHGKDRQPAAETPAPEAGTENQSSGNA